MREIVLDTETTGLDPYDGHKLVEIGCIELMNHVPTGRQFHEYLNPQRSMPEEAFRVHGLSSEFLSGKPLFKDVADRFLEFIADARLVIHNAQFDLKFINAELATLKRAPVPADPALVVDTLAIARSRFPGSPASLDALCKRFAIDNSARTLHGALLDAEILAEVYLELEGGRQPGLVLQDDGRGGIGDRAGARYAKPRPAPLAPLLTAEEEAAHAAFVRGLPNEAPLWIETGLLPDPPAES